jgi:phenylacetate-coenzyme A ligase PaaK-like adenylate-forming protein
VDRLERLNALLGLVAQTNAFQRERIGDVRLADLDDLPRLPLTHKEDLIADQAAQPPFGTNLTFPIERYTHVHQTSGTTGATLRVLDTPEDWAWWEVCLAKVLRAAGYADPRAMDEIKVEVELAQPLEARAIQARLRQRLGLRVRIVPVKPGILPVQLGKARRVEDLRPRPAEREPVGG